MSRQLLRLFGGLGIAAGLAVLFLGFETGQPVNAAAIAAVLPVASACFVAGALLVGFAEAIGLLERIAQNTARRDGA